MGTDIEREGIDFSRSFKKRVGNGLNTRFWDERWADNQPLKRTFKRLSKLVTDKESLVADWVDGSGGIGVRSVGWRREPRGRERGEWEELTSILNNITYMQDREDRMVWELDPQKEFTVRRMRWLLEDKRSARGGTEQKTTWDKAMPKKVNVFMWRLKRGRIPVRSVLDTMGVDLDTVLCPRCRNEIETTDHALVKCAEVQKLWNQVGRWWDANLGSAGSIEGLLSLPIMRGGQEKQARKWRGMVSCFMYLIWGNRNKMVFDNDSGKVDERFFEFQLKSFDWVTKRDKELAMRWEQWLICPRDG